MGEEKGEEKVELPFDMKILTETRKLKSKKICLALKGKQRMDLLERNIKCGIRKAV